MIRIEHKKDCCGCTACASICAHHCITMQEDPEGFLYPKVDVSKCTDCGLCERVCPMLHSVSERSILQVLAAKHKDEVIRKESSSGGVFSILAETIIADGGVVVGCAMNESLQAVHVICETKEELVRLRSSKYVQSDLNGVFLQIRRLLRDGRNVLFSGTPCQVAGLRNFLMKPYNNLYCIDVLCHGVPSPKLYREYLKIMEGNNGAQGSFISFRSKRKEWKRLYINIKFENNKEYFKYSGFDPYMQLFLSNTSQRNSCFHCPYTTLQRQGDISLGDFWGIGKEFYHLDDNKGISMVLLNSTKGERWFAKVRDYLDVHDSKIARAVEGNKVLVKNIPGEDKRNLFYKDFVQNGFKSAVKVHTTYFPLWQQWYLNFMRFNLDILRRILRRTY